MREEDYGHRIEITNTNPDSRETWEEPPHTGTYPVNGNGHESRESDSGSYGSREPMDGASEHGEMHPYWDEAVGPTSEDQEVRERPARSSLKPLIVEILQTVLLTLVIFAGVRSVVQNFKVDGASMEPTLHTGQYLLINKVAYLRLEGLPLEMAQDAGIAPKGGDGYYPFGGPQHGDIVVFKYPGGPDRDFIKRVIAVPGDTVQIDKGRVYVNGTVLDEDYIRAVPAYSLPAQKVPEGNFFVLGDNRPNSSDSHIWGYVPADNMIGRAWVSYWPPNEWGIVVSKEGFANSQ